MADDTLATAKLSIVVDTSNFEASVNRAKNAATSLSKEAEAAYAKLSSSQKKALDSATRQIDLFGKTWQEKILYNLERKGVPTTILDELKTKFAAVGTEAARAGKELNQYGVSAAQQAAALRGVPAQLTDIIVGLQGGQSPLTVALQQGGQLRDMFGGIVPAAKALGAAALGLVNPFTLAAGAASALAIAYKSGTNETQAFNQALILTGNVSGQTANELSDLARSISETGVSQGSAARVLTQVVSSGKIATDSYREVAQAALDLESITGTAADKTLAVFERLADEPTKASAALNEQYHYLTASIYEQIAALERQGDKDQAAALAQKTFANAIKQRHDEVIASAGTLERAWDSLGNVAKKAWDKMLNIGRPTPMADLKAQAKAIQDQIAQLQGGDGFATSAGGAAFGGGGNARAQALKRLQTQLAPILQQISDEEKKSADARAAAEAQAANDAKISAQSWVDDLRKSSRSRAQIRDEEVAQARKNAAILGLSVQETQRLIDQVNAKYKEPAGNAPTDSAATKMLLTLKEQGAALQEQLDSSTKLTAQQEALAKFEQQIADLKNKSVLTADQRSLLASQDAIRAQLQENVALGDKIRLKQESVRLSALEQSLASKLAADQRQYSDQLGAYGLGTKEQERLRSQQSIYRDYGRQLDQITSDRTTGKISESSFQEQTNALRQNLDQRLSALQGFYAEQDKLQGDWKLGFQHAYADYLEQSENVYEQVGDVFKSVTGGMEDAFANFVTTGKLSFKSLADSILSDLARIAARQAVVGAIGSIAGAITGGSGASAGLEAAASAAQSSGGDGIGTLLAGLSAGGRASGGPTAPNTLYRVNEEGPELYTVGGKTYLMSGGAGGYVTPLMKGAASKQTGGQSIGNVTVIFQSDGQTKQEGQGNEFADGLIQTLKAYVDQRISRSYKPGGAGWNVLNGRAPA